MRQAKKKEKHEKKAILNEYEICLIKKKKEVKN